MKQLCAAVQAGAKCVESSFAQNNLVGPVGQLACESGGWPSGNAGYHVVAWRKCLFHFICDLDTMLDKQFGDLHYKVLTHWSKPSPRARSTKMNWAWSTELAVRSQLKWCHSACRRKPKWISLLTSAAWRAAAKKGAPDSSERCPLGGRGQWSHKPQCGMSRLDQRKAFFIARVVKYWIRLPGKLPGTITL